MAIHFAGKDIEMGASPFHKELAGCVLQWMQQASQATKLLFITDTFCHFDGTNSRMAVFLPRSASLAT